MPKLLVIVRNLACELVPPPNFSYCHDTIADGQAERVRRCMLPRPLLWQR